MLFLSIKSLPFALSLPLFTPSLWGKKYPSSPTANAMLSPPIPRGKKSLSLATESRTSPRTEASKLTPVRLTTFVHLTGDSNTPFFHTQETQTKFSIPLKSLSIFYAIISLWKCQKIMLKN